MVSICVFGDSTTWGAWDEERGGWVNRLQLSLAPEYNYELEIYNLGVSDGTTNDILKRFDVEAEARKPDVIIISTGKNDAAYRDSEDNPFVNPERFKKNIAELIRKAKKFTSKIVFSGLTTVDNSKTAPIPWNTSIYYTNERFRTYEKIMREVCAAQGVLFIELSDLLKSGDFDVDDGLHPNARGHKKIAKRMEEFLLTHELI